MLYVYNSDLKALRVLMFKGEFYIVTSDDLQQNRNSCSSVWLEGYKSIEAV